MPVRKRHEVFEDPKSEEDLVSSDAETAADSRTAGLVSPSSKRRKLSSGPRRSELESDTSFAEEQHLATAGSEASQMAAEDQRANARRPGFSKLPPVTRKPSKADAPGRKKTPGVIYLSRIPPFMRPSAVRTLLSVHGPITKLFLTPEPPSHYLARRKHGGNKKRSYIDGWVEFARKRDAKACVDAINGQIVGGKKGGWYRDDVWNAKYLRGFTWEDLMAGVRSEEREREEKVRVGVGRGRREQKEFLQNLERAKVEGTRQKKREKKLEIEGGGTMIGCGDRKSDASTAQDDRPVEADKSKQEGFARWFRQNKVKGKTDGQAEQADEVRGVLSKIF
ncbi:Activator of basal transcription 1 [Puttea exsequens]|nr:Activator of basal transcription 1 [Puttea exsequens]